MLEINATQTSLRTGSHATIARVRGSVDGTTLGQFQNQLRSLLTNQEIYVALILSELRYINSSGMGALIKLSDKFAEAGGKLIAVDLTPRLRELFVNLNIADVVPMFDTIGDGLRAFERLATDKAGTAVEARPLYPILVRCTGCKNAVEIPDAGYFRCPRCGTCFAAAREGKVRGYRVDPAVGLEVRAPSSEALEPALRELGIGLAKARQLPADEGDALGGLLGECLRAVAAASSGPDSEIRVVVATDDKEVRVAVRSPEPCFTAEGPEPAREALRTVRAHLDEMEIVGLPGGGQMLRGARRLRRAP